VIPMASKQAAQK